MAGGPGYDIGASLANDAAASSNPFEDEDTIFIFGNSDNPDLSSTQTPTLTSTATATTALPGGVAESTVPISTNAPAGVAAAGASGSPFSIETILLLGAAGLVAFYFLHKK